MHVRAISLCRRRSVCSLLVSQAFKIFGPPHMIKSAALAIEVLRFQSELTFDVISFSCSGRLFVPSCRLDCVADLLSNLSLYWCMKNTHVTVSLSAINKTTNNKYLMFQDPSQMHRLLEIVELGPKPIVVRNAAAAAACCFRRLPLLATTTTTCLGLRCCHCNT